MAYTMGVQSLCSPMLEEKLSTRSADIRTWLTAAVLAFPACAVRTEAPVPVDVQSLAFSRAGQAERPADWWTSFDDPGLDTLVDEALTGNFTVRAAFARLEAARAVVRRTRSDLGPSVSAFVDGSVGTDDPFGGVQRVPVEGGFRASYEIDLWGRIRASLRADVERFEEARSDAEVAALSLTADVVRTWVALAAVEEQLTLLDEQIRANEGLVRVVEARFLNGVVRQADTLRQERLLEQTRAAKLDQLAAREVLQHRLAVLVGRPPQETISSPSVLPEVPALPDPGVPAELLRRRPDVLAAEHAVRAADADVAAAIANQFPRLTLTGLASNAPVSPADLLRGWVASLSAGLFAPLFESGRRRAEVRRTRAIVEAELAEYGAVVLNALREVEDALARDRVQVDVVDNVTRQVGLAERAASGLQAQYVGGLEVGYLDTLTAQTTSQQLRRQQIAARQEALFRRIDLYVALAGGVVPPSEDDDA